MPQPLRPARPLALAALLGAAAGAALPAAAGAERPAKPTAPNLLTVSSLRTGTRDAPVAVTVRRLGRDARLRAWVNGRPAHDAFQIGAAGARHGTLSARHGLRHGRNVIRLRAVRADGHHDVERRVVTIARKAPLADAGPDVVTTDADVTVGPRRKGIPGDDAQLRSRWSIVAAPAGSDAELEDPTATRPTLAGADDGTYVLRHAVTDGDGDASYDTVAVSERPDDPPIGARLHTIRSGAANITIGADTVVAPTTREMAYAVLERATRKVVKSGSVSVEKTGAAELLSICKSYAATDDHMMLVSSSNGRPPEAVPVLDDLLTCLGGPRLTRLEQAGLYRFNPFTFIGLPGAPVGAAWSKVRYDGTERDADIDVWLQFNDATQKYDTVDLRQPTYDTRLPGKPAGTNTMRFNGSEVTARLENGATAGLHLVAVDDAARVLQNVMLPTNGPGGADAQLQAAMARTLRDAANLPARPTLLLQSVGNVKAAAEPWNDAAELIASLGGNRWAFNELQGQAGAGYALVGRLDHDLPAAEASPVLGDETARLVGNLARTRHSFLEPLVQTTAGAITTQMTEVLSQQPEPFPTVNVPAMTYLAKRLGFCGEAAATCDLRAAYWKRYRSEWLGKKSTLESAQYPGDGRGFDEAQFRATKEQLVGEVTLLTDTRNYFEQLKRPFEKAQRATQVDLRAITDTVKRELNPGDGWLTPSWKLALTSYSLKVGVFAGPPANKLFEGMSAVFMLSSFLSNDAGRPTLADQLQVRADRLGEQLAESYDQAGQNIDAIALIVASDWGRLRTVGSKVDNDWALPAQDGKALLELRKAARTSAARTLAVSAYPALVMARPQVGDANGLECRVPSGGKGPPGTTHPWSGMSQDVQVKVADTIDGQGRWTRKGVFMIWDHRTYPSQVVGDLLYKPTNARPTPGVGLTKLELMQPNSFAEPLRVATDLTDRCGIRSIWVR